MFTVIAYILLTGTLSVHAQKQLDEQQGLQKRAPAYSNARDSEASLSGFRDIRPIQEINQQERQEDTKMKPKIPHSPVDEVEFGGRPEIDPEEVR